MHTVPPTTSRDKGSLSIYLSDKIGISRSTRCHICFYFYPTRFNQLLKDPINKGMHIS
jgi:hypothetical protein